MLKTVYIVNGPPRAGKDTFIHFMTVESNRMGRAAYEFSSIDPIRDMLSPLIDLSTKTPADRKLLATIGDLVEEHSGFRTKRCIDFVSTSHGKSYQDADFFLQIREPELIERVRTALLKTDRNCTVVRVQVMSDRAHTEFSNSADAGAVTAPYDVLIENNGTLGELYDKAHALLTSEHRRPVELAC